MKFTLTIDPLESVRRSMDLFRRKHMANDIFNEGGLQVTTYAAGAGRGRAYQVMISGGSAAGDDRWTRLTEGDARALRDSLTEALGDGESKSAAVLLDTLRDTATKPTDIARYYFLRLLSKEVDHALGKHGREPWSRHEFYGILAEEVDELWRAVKQSNPDTTNAIIEEAIQVAAVCCRYYETGDRFAGPHDP